jgi:hypothetical protein
MAKVLPRVLSKSSQPKAILYTWSLQQPHQQLTIRLDTPDWFQFLAQERSFRLTYHLPQGGSLNLTIRPEKRGTGTYWQAWKSINGHTTKKYLAPSAKLTKAKLDAIGQLFFDLIQAQTAADPTQPLYAALVDLSWLVQRLIEHCPQPALAQHAQSELGRIHQQFGNSTYYQPDP